MPTSVGGSFGRKIRNGAAAREFALRREADVFGRMRKCVGKFRTGGRTFFTKSGRHIPQGFWLLESLAGICEPPEAADFYTFFRVAVLPVADVDAFAVL